LSTIKEIRMQNDETRKEETQEPPDRPPESAVNGTQNEKEEENEELEWARRHIREERAAPRREPARAPDPKPEPEPEPEEESGNAKPIGRCGRGKGRPPHRMLKEAVMIAKKRGGIIRVPGGRSDAFDMIVCEEFRNVYVRLRWSGTPYLSSRDVLGRYTRDIGRMVRLPQTRVMAWELWLREPQDLWQYFLITQNGIVEIRDDGTIYYRPLLPLPVADEAKSSPDGGGYSDGDGPSPDMDP
jgi:hypothetical protein